MGGGDNYYSGSENKPSSLPQINQSSISNSGMKDSMKSRSSQRTNGGMGMGANASTLVSTDAG